MTLIITSIRQQDVLITSDGRSTLTRDGKVVSIKDDLQKIFMVPEHPVVVVHHGENLLDGQPVGLWIEKFARELNAGNLSIEQMMDELRGRMHPLVRKRLRATAGSGFGFGLIVAGFGAGEERPGGMEVFWKIEKEALTTSERTWRPVTVVMSGNGAAQTGPVDWREVDGKGMDLFRAYHGGLMTRAIEAPLEHNPVGGQVHEVHVTREGWRWAVAPKGK